MGIRPTHPRIHGTQHASDLAGILRAECIRDAVIVGHAGGGETALAFARSCTEPATQGSATRATPGDAGPACAPLALVMYGSQMIPGKAN